MAYDPNRGGRTGEAKLLPDLLCPRCGNRHILYYLLTDEQGRHLDPHPAGRPDEVQGWTPRYCDGWAAVLPHFLRGLRHG